MGVTSAPVGSQGHLDLWVEAVMSKGSWFPGPSSSSLGSWELRKSEHALIGGGLDLSSPSPSPLLPPPSFQNDAQRSQP